MEAGMNHRVPLRAGALDGLQAREEIVLELPGQQDRFVLEVRPLRTAEATRVRKILKRGVKVVTQPPVGGRMKTMQLSTQVLYDPEASTEGEDEAFVVASALGTLEESITVEVIQAEWPASWPRIVGKRVMELSGIDVPGEEDEEEEQAEPELFPGGES